MRKTKSIEWINRQLFNRGQNELLEKFLVYKVELINLLASLQLLNSIVRLQISLFFDRV